MSAERFEPDPSALDGVRRIVVCPDCGWWEKEEHTIGAGQPCEVSDGDEGWCGGTCVLREVRIVSSSSRADETGAAADAASEVLSKWRIDHDDRMVKEIAAAVLSATTSRAMREDDDA